MWIFVTDGFFSVVEKQDDTAMVVVRSRELEDIKRLSDKFMIPVLRTPDRDYPYRLFCSKYRWVEYLVECVNNMFYTNFKQHMEDSGAEPFRIEQLHTVWAVMQERPGHDHYDFRKGVYNGGRSGYAKGLFGGRTDPEFDA
jgi:hypothetical protein